MRAADAGQEGALHGVFGEAGANGYKVGAGGDEVAACD